MTLRILWLRRILRLFIVLAVFSLLFVMLDYITDAPSSIQTNLTRAPLPEMELDKAYFIRQDNKQIVVVRYSDQMQQKLFVHDEVVNTKPPDYLVAYAYGTNLGCPLELSDDGQLLKESCSQAYYDFSGRPADNKQGFTALRIPVYTFCTDYSCLNIQFN